MRKLAYWLSLGLLLLPAYVSGQPTPIRKGDKLAPAVAPSVSMASAVERGGEVVVQISLPGIRLTEKTEKNVKGWVYVWEAVAPMTLGKQVLAYTPAGKRSDKEAVVKALARPVPVACFVRKNPDDPELPDPAYAGVFRDDTVLLVFKAQDMLR